MYHIDADAQADDGNDNAVSSVGIVCKAGHKGIGHAEGTRKIDGLSLIDNQETDRNPKQREAVEENGEEFSYL